MITTFRCVIILPSLASEPRHEGSVRGWADDGSGLTSVYPPLSKAVLYQIFEVASLDIVLFCCALGNPVLASVPRARRCTP